MTIQEGKEAVRPNSGTDRSPVPAGASELWARLAKDPRLQSFSLMPATLPAPPSFPALRAAIKEVCAGLPVARIELFGSVARGEARAGSDVDLMVEFLPEANAGLFEMGAMKEDLEEKIGCRVDLLSRRAVEQSRNQYRRAILENPVTIYAR